MTKLTSHTRFSESTNLFRFCLRVLELRRPSQKINDQHLGQLLGLSPSDTSHWKRGKKVFKKTEYIHTLSKSLNLNTEILKDLADNSIDLAEAWSEFHDAEEEISKNSQFLSSLSPHIKSLEFFASCILDDISLKSVPVDITALIQAFPFIHLLPSDSVHSLATSARIKPGSYVIRYPKGTIRPHTRLAIVREISNIILTSEYERYTSLSCSIPYTHSEVVTLSNALLIPSAALANEFQTISQHNNLLQNLAEKFNVPKSAMRKRLTTLISQSASLTL